MTRSTHETGSESAAGASGVVRAVVHYQGSSGGLLRELLGVHARLGGAAGAVMLRLAEPGRVDAIVEWGVGDGAGTRPRWMEIGAEIVAEIAGSDRPAVVRPIDDGWVVVVPLAVLDEPRAACAFLLGPMEAADARRSAARLELGVVALWAHRLVSHQSALGPGAARVGAAVEIASVVMAQEDLRGVAAALVNELAPAVGADRVGVGIARGGAHRWIRVEALSGIDRVHRSMSIVPVMEAAMEECAEQDQEILAPAPADATVISRAHRECAAREGAPSVVSLPIRSRDAGDPIVGVVTMLASADRPIGIAEVEFVRLVLELVSARVGECRARSGWAGARVVRWARGAAGRFVGPEHALAKVGAIAIAAGVVASMAVTGPERIGAPATVVAGESRVCAAPAETVVVAVDVEPGDTVRAGETVLGQLDASAVRLELAEALARVSALEQAEAAARGAGDTAEAQIARAQRDEASARVALLRDRVERMRIVAPIDGVVVRGPDRSRIGTVVSVGEELFEIASPAGLRFEARAPVRWMEEIGPGVRGALTLSGRPGPAMEVVVEHGEPVVRAGPNGEPGDAFLVWGTIAGPPEWARAGMQGVARFEVGRAPMLTIWTRRAADTIRAWGWW